MGFESTQNLYGQLASDGSPVCRECGLLYPEPGHREEHKAQRRKRQPGVGGGHRVELPDASAARGLFREAIQELDWYISLVDAEESWLEGNLEEGEFKGKHFITHTVDRDALEVARREEFTEVAWKELCEEHGVDPERDQLPLSRGEATPGGVTKTPSALLTTLIAAYALAPRLDTDSLSHPLKPLVEALHYDPDSAAWEDMADNLDELRKVAGHLAARVRGAVVGRGRGITEVSREKHFLAWLIQTYDDEGLPPDEELFADEESPPDRELSPDEKLLKELKKRFPGIAGDLTAEDIDRIRREHLESPE